MPRMATRPEHLILLSFSFLLLLLINSSHSQRNWPDLLERGGSTIGLTSANGVFELGFVGFSSISGNETLIRRDYLRICYAGARGAFGRESDYRPYLWIGNPDNPHIDGGGSLEIDSRGSLKIVPAKGSDPIFLYAAEAPTNTSATLEDDGNFVLREFDKKGSSRILWQSFDHPTNTLLPGMKLGINHKTGQNWSLTSWRSDGNSPSFLDTLKGAFTLGLDPESKDQLVIWWMGDVYWKSGKLNGNSSLLRSEFERSDTYISNENETYFSYTADRAVFPFALLALTDDGKFQDENGRMLAYCEPFSKYLEDGCTQQKPKMCKRKKTVVSQSCQSGFMTVEGFKFPESDNLSLAGCEAICFRTCSCIAYASTNIYGTGCEIWSSRASFRSAPQAAGHRVCLLEEDNWWLWLAVAVGGFSVLVPLVSMIWMICLKFQEKGEGYWTQKMILKELGNGTSAFWKKKAKDQEKEGNELRIFSFEIVAAATDYFSRKNKLGEGGYGPVYKGKLPNGQQIAIKRLSRTSGQGLVEFKNEVVLIAKLQHTNLVRLLGLCIQGEEKILIYEYMPNKSLDFFIFDSERSGTLRWEKRFAIIEGIAQGLLYLHKYSRLRVIHRDLKASNILLDNEMNPKISDFGLARIFEVHETEANTNRIVGTHGYMAPEYAYQGIVSIKTDVFSFGVLLLEIISGKKNNSLYHSEYPLNLIGYAWQLWNDGRALELMDPTMGDESCPHNEVLRCFHVGLMCVQENAKDRPNMLDVISMLSHPSMPITAPKQPAFFFSTVREEHDVSEWDAKACSINQVTVTVMEAR